MHEKAQEYLLANADMVAHAACSQSHWEETKMEATMRIQYCWLGINRTLNHLIAQGKPDKILRNRKTFPFLTAKRGGKWSTSPQNVSEAKITDKNWRWVNTTEIFLTNQALDPQSQIACLEKQIPTLQKKYLK
jgi:hypothetical protein